MIDDYLAELLGALHLPASRRRRIVSEVEDHLACVAAELHAEGLDAEQAEREAISRFGPAAELAHTFHEQEAARGGLRGAQVAVHEDLVAAIDQGEGPQLDMALAAHRPTAPLRRRRRRASSA